jgi:mannosyltransferase
MTPRGILMVTGAYWPELSGGGLQCRTMIHSLKDSFRFRVFTTCTDRSLPADDVVEGIAVTRALVDPARFLTKIGAAWATVVFFARHHSTFDVVHLHGFSQKSVPVILLARLFSKKVVITIHTAGQDEPEAIRRQGWLAFRCYASADRFVAISPAIADNFRRSPLPVERLVLVPNAVDTNRFVPLDDERRAQLRATLHLARADVPWILFVGFFSHEKGPRILFDAWLRLIDVGLQCALVFVGASASSYSEVDPTIADGIRLDTTARGLEHLVHFAGAVGDVERYYQMADIYAMPSVREAFGMSLVEAMATEIPVVATRIPGVTDEIVDDGVTGILVEPRDINGLADAIEALLRNPSAATAMGRRARVTVAQRFALDAAAERWSAIYQKVIG